MTPLFGIQAIVKVVTKGVQSMYEQAALPSKSLVPRRSVEDRLQLNKKAIDDVCRILNEEVRISMATHVSVIVAPHWIQTTVRMIVLEGRIMQQATD